MNPAPRTPPSPGLERLWRWLAPNGAPSGRLAVVTALALAAVWILYFSAEDPIVAIVSGDQLFTHPGAELDLDAVRRDLRLFLLVATAASGAALGLVYALARASSRLLHVAFSLSFTTLCAAIIMRALMKGGYEGEWYPLDALLNDPASLPIFGRRLLFAWPAKALTSLHPAITPYRAFLAVQAPVAWLSCASAARFCRCFGGTSFALAGEAVFALMTAAVIDYFNFYDIAIAMFFALGLCAALAGRWALFALIVGVGTLNHENILLLIPTAAFVRWRAEPPKRLALAVGAALGVHVAARLAMAALVPAPGLMHLRIWTNASSVLHPSIPLAHALSVLGPALVAAAIGFRFAERELRRMTILFPMLLVVTFLAGKFAEPRQFIAMFPVVAALIATAAGRLAPDNGPS